MNKEWVLTQEAFNRLLMWLDADPERAARKYEAVRRRLIEIFNARRCSEAEDLADETINRVTSKVSQIEETYTGDPALYFYAVAKKIYLEYTSRKPTLPLNGAGVVGCHALPLVPGSDDVEEAEREDACLSKCLGELSERNRELVLGYYQSGEGRRAHRGELAAQMGAKTVNALRIRAHRIRVTLRQCVELCLGRQVSV
jgi:DNA-directed RNA polymerase specialized sigma24 family protein